MNTTRTSRFAAVALTALLAAGLTACSNKTEQPEPIVTPTVTPTASPTVTPEPSPEPTPTVAPEDEPTDAKDRFEHSGASEVAEVFGEELAARLVESGWEVNRLGWGGGAFRELHKPHDEDTLRVLSNEWLRDLMTGDAWTRFDSYLSSDDADERNKAAVIAPAVGSEDGLIAVIDGTSYFVDASLTAPFAFFPGDVTLFVSEEGLAVYQQDSLVTAKAEGSAVVSMPVTVYLSFAPGVGGEQPWLLDSWYVASNGDFTVQVAS